jgi:quercetin dioxygenase-like cupin family protein
VKPKKERKNNESTHSVQKNPHSALMMAPALIVGAAFTAVPARATPSCMFTSTNLLYPGQPLDTAHAGHFPSGSLDLMCRSNLPDWLLNTRVRGDSDLYVAQNTWQPGGHTGWHTHPGPSLITIVSGALTVYEASDPTCTPQIYTAGQSFTDIGCGDIHLVANESSVVAVAVAIQIVPAGAPRRIDEPAPGNCATILCPAPTPSP